MNLNLEGKVAIITGAGRGIGRTTALTLCKEGANVVIDDVDIELARRVVEEARALGAQAIAVKADVTRFDEARQMVKETLAKFGKIDILVNNAGILYKNGEPYMPKLFEQYDEEDWRDLINITLYGVLNCSKAVLDHMLGRKRGSIVNIVSDAGRHPRAGRITIYGAGKGGIIAFTRNLAWELGPYGIRCNCISPGVVNTTRAQMMATGADKSASAIKFWEDVEASIKRMPLGRIADPQEIANAIVFIASDAASYITGQTLSVNGGLFML